MRNSVALRATTTTGFSTSKKARILMLALAPVAAFMAAPALAATQTWDPLLNLSGSDGPGNWDTTTTNWATAGADTAWINDGTSTAVFGSGGTPGTVTITVAAINAAAINFNLGYTINANAGSTLTVPSVTVASGQAATINAPIAGTGGVTLLGGGNLTLGGNNTYSGGTTINAGILSVNNGATLGAAANALVLGNTAGTLNTAAGAIFNGNATVGSFNDTTQTAVNTLQVASGQILTVSGAFTVGQVVNNSTANMTLNTGTAGAGTGGELDVNGNMTIGANPGGGSKIQATVDLSNLSTFKLNAPTGTLNVANGTNIKGIFTLASGANANNFINVATINFQTSAGGNSNGGGSFNFGSGNNTIQASTINIGTGKSNGNFQFISGAPATASVTIAGTGGSGARANITMDSESSGTGNGPSNLNLAGHVANVFANNVLVGLDAAGAGNATASITFDTGTFDVNSLQLAGGTSGSAVIAGNFTLGGATPNNTATGVLNVNNSFFLANNGGTTTGAATGTFTINGGTANINSDITNPSTKTSTTNLNLNAGTLNMMGHAIGSATVPITTVALGNTAGQVATLANLGGTGINGAGLTAGGAGSLILTGTNSYSGGTTVNTTLQVGTATQAGSLPVGTVANNGALTFAGAGTSAITTLTGGGSTVINAGSVSVGNASGFSGTITVNTGGNLTGTATFPSVTLAGGNIAPGAGISDVSGVMTINNLTVSSGNFTFNLGDTTSSSISAGTATFSGTPTFAFNLVGSPTTGQTYTVLTASTLNDGGFLSTLAPVSVGRTTLTPSESGSSIIVTVSGGPASIVWNGAADGTTWDTHTSSSGTQNWLNGATQDFFFTNDNVTFNDNNNGHYNVTLVGNLTPGSVKINSANTYTFAGAGAIVGTTDLTKDGTGTLILANTGTNTYSGGTNIENGTLVIGAAGALPANSAVSFGDGSGNSGTLDLGGNNVSVSSLTENLGSNVIGSSGSSAAGITFNGGVNSSTFNGVIKNTLGAGSGTVALTVASGNLTLGGANTYTGGTNVTGGSLTLNGSLAGPNISTAGSGVFNIAAAASIPAATVLTNNGTTNLGNPNTTLATLNGTAATGVLNLNGSNLSITAGGNYAGAINDGSAPGTLNVPSGNLTLTGSSNYSGTTTIASGALVKANHSDSATVPTKTSLGIPAGGNVTIASGGTLDIGGNTSNNTLNLGQKTFFVSGTGTTGTGAIINSGTALEEDAFNNITLQGDTTFSGTRFDIGRNFAGNTLDLAGHTLTTNMSGAQPIFGILGNLTATPLHVTGGQIFVNSGGLDIERNASVPADGTSLITLNTGTNLELFNTDGTSFTRPIILLGNNTIGSGSNATAFSVLGAPVTAKGNLTFEANGSGVPSLTAVDPLTVISNITESGASVTVTKTGVATLTLGNATVAPVNVWTGGTLLQEATTTLFSNTALPTGTAVTIGTATTAATLDLNGTNTTVGSLNLGTGSAAVTGVFSNLTPTSTNTTTLTFTTLPAGAVPGALISGTGIPVGDVISAINTANKTVTLAVANTNANGTALTGITISSNIIGSSSTTANSTLTYTTGTSSFGGIIQDSVNAGTQTVALNVASGNLTLTNANTYSGGTSISGGNLIVGNVNALGKAGVAIHTGGTLQLAAGLPSAVSVPSISFDGTPGNWTGSLNLNNNKLIVEDSVTHAASLANLETQSNTVITSSGSPADFAVAVLDNAILNKTTFGGVTVDPNSILVGPELLGDANADGAVDLTDLSTVLNNFGSSTLAWTSGNFDGSSTIDLTDLSDVLNNFGAQNPNPSDLNVTRTVATPEPTSLALLTLSATALLRRRRNA